MASNYYRITFLAKKNGYKHWVIDLSAGTLVEAKEKAKAMWDKDAHMFHLEVRRLKDTEEFLYHWFQSAET